MKRCEDHGGNKLECVCTGIIGTEVASSRVGFDPLSYGIQRGVENIVQVDSCDFRALQAFDPPKLMNRMNRSEESLCDIITNRLDRGSGISGRNPDSREMLLPADSSEVPNQFLANRLAASEIVHQCRNRDSTNLCNPLQGR